MNDQVAQITRPDLAGLHNGTEICGLTDLADLHDFPAGTRLITRREWSHPGAQLSLFDTVNGMRHRTKERSRAATKAAVPFQPIAATARRQSRWSGMRPIGERSCR